MLFIDTHAHLYSTQFGEESAMVVERAVAQGVEHMLLPDVDSTSRAALNALAERYPLSCHPMVGVHPTSINDNPAWREEIATVERLLGENAERYCAVGEIGIDLYWSRDFEAEQREAFTFQVELALKYNLPIAVHSREAWEVIIELLTPYRNRGVRGVIHAFTGNIEHYRTLKSLGNFIFGIGGVVTFKNSPLAPVVAQMELKDIVLETDAPYLTPVPHRGKRNESAYIPHIAQCIANLHAITLEEVALSTTATATQMFLG